MEFLNKIKAKISEEMSESEREDASGTSNRRSFNPDGPKTVKDLELEVNELKEHINKNYQIYTRKLERRRQRIRDLEEYSKLLIKDNEALQEKQNSYDSLQKELTSTRENLDQLEGFQSQELAKVKHMLLNAEVVLEQERKERKRIEAEANPRLSNGKIEDDHQTIRNELEDKIKQLQADYESKISRLEQQLQRQDLSEDDKLAVLTKERDEAEAKATATEQGLAKAQQEALDFEKKLTEAESRLAESEARVKVVMQERDAVKNSLLELEIANHERQESSGSEKEKERLDKAKLVTEKETLEVTLDLRDKELKAKKEEHRLEVNRLQQAIDDGQRDVQAKSAKIAALEAEVAVFKGKHSEEAKKALAMTTKLDKLAQTLKETQDQLDQRQNEKQGIMAEVETLRNDLSQAEAKAAKAEADFLRVNGDYDDLVLKLDEASRQLEVVVPERDRLQSECSRLSTEVIRLADIIKEKEATFDERVERTELVAGLREALKKAEDELHDKNKIIKLHQHKVNEMKKTFQKEMKSSSSFALAEMNGTREDKSPSPSQSIELDGLGSADSTSSSTVTMTEVNFKYLKHVIFKFFTSPAFEAKHLVRAISVLLKMTPDEEKLLESHLDWKMSWFGSRPRLGSGQFALSIDPS